MVDAEGCRLLCGQFRGGAQGGQVESAAVGAFAASDPVVVGLVRKAPIFDQAVAIACRIGLGAPSPA